MTRRPSSSDENGVNHKVARITILRRHLLYPFVVPPELEGLPDKVSYSCTDRWIIERIEYADGRMRENVHLFPTGDHEFKPWLRKPKLGKRLGVARWIERGKTMR
jgi:hypothetical protein